jgi:hypothetical protein
MASDTVAHAPPLFAPILDDERLLDEPSASAPVAPRMPSTSEASREQSGASPIAARRASNASVSTSVKC